MRFRKLIFTLSIILMGLGRSFAAMPATWSVKTENYQYNMTVVSSLFIEGEFSTDPNDALAAFVGGECRGVAHPVTDANTGKALAYLMVFSNQAAGETVDLKIYDASEDKVFNLQSTITFSNNKSEGSAQEPFLSATNYAPKNLELNDSTLVENLAAGTLIGELSATDADQGNILTYSLVAGYGDNSSFEVSGTSLKSKAVFNYEVKNSYSIRVKVDDGHNGSLEKNFTISVEDENEAPAITAGQSFIVNDEGAEGTVVGNLKVADEDQGQQLSYSITSGNVDGIFEIQSTGAIVIAAGKKADFEKKSAYTLSIKVEDDGVPSKSDEEDVAISVTDVNFDPTAIHLSNNKIDENVAAGTEIGTLTADDIEPEETFTFTLPDEVPGSEDFKIVGNKIFSARSFNHEAQPIYSKNIKVVDSKGGEYVDRIIIHINDLNEAPVIVDQEFSIKEASPLGSFVDYVTISDVDDNQTHSFLITGGNTNAAFKLDKNTGELTINNANEIDFEKNSEFTLTIEVSDNGLPEKSDTRDIKVNILDINYEPSDILLSNTTIDENLGTDSWVGNLTGVDPEPNEHFTFSLEAGISDNDLFSINTSNQLIAKNTFDYESRSNYRVYITVKDQVGAIKIKPFDIYVNDLNEDPNITANQVFSIAEDKQINSVVGDVKASDPDRNQMLIYSIIDGNLKSAFKIDKQTGVISVNNPLGLDFETTPVFSLKINVEDDGEPSRATQETVTINLDNVSYAPETLTLSASVIDENENTGTIIGDLSATDREPETFTFSLPAGEEDNDKFSILNNKTLVSNSVFNFEEQSKYFVKVLVTDGEGETLSEKFSIEVADVNEKPTIGNQTFDVDEEKQIGTTVGVLVASDIEHDQSLIYEIVGGNTNNAFKLDVNTGELTVNNPSAINYESVQVFNLDIKITDNGIPALSDQAVATINVNDINYSPVALSLSANHIDENMQPGTSIGTFTADDPETEETFKYYLPAGEKSNDLFTIDENSGELKSAQSFNHEQTASFPIKVVVEDSKGSTLARQFTVVVDNVNEAPVLDNITFSIAEEKPVGSVVGYTIASDVDRNQSYSYSVVANGANKDNAFKIDQQTGEISVNNPLALDYETYTSFTLTIEVADNGVPALRDQATVTINVIDINHDPSELNLSAFEIKENAVSGTVIGQLSALDPEPGETFSFSLPDGELDNEFFSLNAQNQVVSNQVFNYENRQSYLIRAKVTDSKGAELVQRFALNVVNVNEQPIIADQTFEVHEDKKLGSVLGYVQAGDLDKNQNLRFEIVPDEFSSAFAIQATSGELTVNNTNALNFEKKNQFALTIRVTDDGNPAMSNEAAITVNILDVNYLPDGVFLDNKTVLENQPKATLIGNLSSSDIEPHETFTFELEDGMFDNHLFEIKDGTKLVTAYEFDYESKNSYSVKVNVTDLSGGVVSEIFQIEIRDVNEKPHLDNMFLEISEDKQNGSVIGYLSVHDVDRGQTFSYELLPEGNTEDAFKVFRNTGEVSINNNLALNYDRNPEFKLRVVVADNGFPALTDTASLEIKIKDINFAPENLQLSYSKIPENSAEGTKIGLLTADDSDQGEVFTYSILAVGDAAPFFRIEGDVLYSNDVFNFEARKEYPLTLQVADSKGASTIGEFMINVTDVNEAPVIEDQQFAIAEDKASGTVIDVIAASDVDEGQNLSFKIVAGNVSDGFKIDGATGQLSINNPAIFDYEGTNKYQLQIKVQDNGNPALTDVAIITVDVLDVNYAPSDIQISGNSFKEIEGGKKFVGKLTASDPEPFETFSFSLPAGENDNNSFVISNDSLYAIGVADYEEKSEWIATVKVTDSKSAVKSKDFTIEIIDVNEQPAIDDQKFTINENAINNSEVGQVNKIKDPDHPEESYNPEDYCKWSIIGGNESGAFDIDPNTGQIYVADRYALDFESHPTFTLAVEVEDDGYPALKNSAVISISLENTSELVLAADNLFSPNGDGINDTWQLETPGQVTGFELIIFNTAGEIVYQTKSYDNNWDGTNNGKQLDEGTYYYMFRNQDGSKTYKGFITLKR